MNLYKEYTCRYNQKTLGTKFSVPPENFLTPRRASDSLCVCLRVSLRSPCAGLRHYAWVHCAATLYCLLWPSVSLCPRAQSLLTPSSPSASATLPCNSPSEIEFDSFRIDLLRVLSVCLAYFTNDPQVFFYNLLIDESTTHIRSLING